MYTIKLPQFEGPFDLLLFFIERDELDIYDIPIAKVANDFLAYLKLMEATNIDMASEFILVAATLMRIKAKMLLPRKALDEEGNEVDPRAELVERLLEYKRYKDVIQQLKALELERSQKKKRGNTHRELLQIAEKTLVDAELESLTLFKLMRTFNQVMQRFREKNKVTKHTIIQYNYTLKEQRTYLAALVKQLERVPFQKTFEHCENRIHAIFTFLALLDLLQLQQLSILVGEGVNNFWLIPKVGVRE